MIGASMSHADWSHLIGNSYALYAAQRALSNLIGTSSLVFLLLFFGGAISGYALNHYLLVKFGADIAEEASNLAKPYKCSHWMCDMSYWNKLTELSASTIVNIYNAKENLHILKNTYVSRIGAR
jgi:hypothetical protein